MRIKATAIIRVPWTFAKAVWRAVSYLFQGRPVLAPKADVEFRMSKCRPCGNNVHGWCSKCVCVLEVKTMIASEFCPDAPPRWKALTFARQDDTQGD